MAKIHELIIKNFRGIKDFSQIFPVDFICLIGRGDSGKSTILDAIAAVLSPSWNLSFFDNDFHNCNIALPIEITVTMKEIPDDLLREDKYGLYQRGLNAKTGTIHDDVEDGHEPVLTIRFKVGSDLEPEWTVVTEREIGTRRITSTDRSKLNTIIVSDFLDRHFSWNKGSPLYTLLQQVESDENSDSSHMIDALRDAKLKIDKGAFSQFEIAVDKVKAAASMFGIDISKTNTTIDYRDIVTKDGKVCLHDKNIPFRLKGKGSKRLISIAIQSAIADAGGIALIDEIEQGLEPDRVQHLLNSLKLQNHGQIFVTTHSRDVLVELSCEHVFLMRKDASSLIVFDSSHQGTLRQNPEAFFAKCIIVCEGPTEMGICRALNEYRIGIGKENIAHMGVRFANGAGTSMTRYAKGFRECAFEVCLFCDSDKQIVNLEKADLRAQGIQVIDWDNGDCLETAIMRDIPFSLLCEVFTLAVQLRHESDSSISIQEMRKAMWESVRSKFGPDCPGDIDSAKDSLPLRLALGRASVTHDKEWFKTLGKGYKLGMLIFNHFAELEGSKLYDQIVALSKWMDKNGS